MKKQKKLFNIMRIFGLIVFNIGMGFLSNTKFNWLWFVIVIFGNAGIIYLTHEDE